MIKWKLQVPGTGCLKAEASRGAALGKLLSTAGTGGAPEQLPAHRKLREKRLCQRDVSMLCLVGVFLFVSGEKLDVPKSLFYRSGHPGVVLPT